MRSLVAALMLATTAGLLTAAGCNALLDIDHIDFGDGPAGGGGGGTAGSGATSGTGGTTSSSGGGTGGTTSGGGTGGDGGFSPEDCTNGVDDNGDNLVDCADPYCSDHLCVEQNIPTSWNGPGIFYLGPSAPSCAGAWPITALSAGAGTLTAPPASCSNCSCGSPNGVSCVGGTTSFWTNSNCNGAATASQTPAALATCEAVTGASAGFMSVQAEPIAPSGGSCSPSGGSPTIPPASYAFDALVCGGATFGAGCPGTEACTPPPGAGYESGICIFRGGNRTCDPPFTVKHLVHASISDNRGCSSCSCGSPSNVSCNGITEIYVGSGNTTCQGSTVALSHGGSCNAVNLAWSMVTLPASASGGSCSPSGGNPIGWASEDGTSTVCCTP